MVSGGFHEVADQYRRRQQASTTAWLTAWRYMDGKLTGKLAAEIVTQASRKLDARSLDWAHRAAAVALAHTVAMGDGANDIPMIQAAGTGIAFCAKPKTREAAPFAIDERNLMLAMDIILRD